MRQVEVRQGLKDAKGTERQVRLQDQYAKVKAPMRIWKRLYRRRVFLQDAFFLRLTILMVYSRIKKENFSARDVTQLKNTNGAWGTECE